MGQVSETDYGHKIANSKIKMSSNDTSKNIKLATFSADDTLPSLPLPTLKSTLEKYLESVKPFLTQLEYLNTEKIVRNFENEIGEKLHFHLSQKAKKEKNWLENWWLEWAYLTWRMPIAPFINTSGFTVGLEYDPVEHDELSKLNIDIQLAKASSHAFFLNKYFDLLNKEQIPIQQSRSKYFSMDQFRRFYNTNRTPMKGQDRLDVYFKTKSEGICPTHLTVIYKKRFFKIEAYHIDGEILNYSELYDQFKLISTKCKTDGIGIGALTADYRDDWAQNRDYLIELHPINDESLDLIAKSLYVIALDDAEPATLEEAVKYGLYKNPKNRFFDKAYTHIIMKNGLVTSNTEHSAYDGIVSGTISHYVADNLKKSNFKLSQIELEKKRQNIPEPVELIFHYDLKIGKEIEKSAGIFEKFGSNLDSSLLTLNYCDKKTLKSYKINPDTFTQVCMQLSYYQLHKKPAPTYETATTRSFYHGRTETVRSCSSEAIEFCKQMCNHDKSTRLNDKSLLDLFKKACNKHDVLMEEARNNSGCDRHLLGLMLTAEKYKIDLPEIYKDVSWTKSGGGGNFVISSSCLGYTNICGTCAPMCENGYTMIYCFSDYGLTFALARYMNSKETDLVKLTDSIQSAFKQVQSLFETVSKI